MSILFFYFLIQKCLQAISLSVFKQWNAFCGDSLGYEGSNIAEIILPANAGYVNSKFQ